MEDDEDTVHWSTVLIACEVAVQRKVRSYR